MYIHVRWGQGFGAWRYVGTVNTSAAGTYSISSEWGKIWKSKRIDQNIRVLYLDKYME